MINFDITINVTTEDEVGAQQFEYTNSVAFDETPTEETIRDTLFGIFKELYINAASEYASFGEELAVFEDDIEKVTLTFTE